MQIASRFKIIFGLKGRFFDIMPRSLVVLLIIVIMIIGAMFFFASRDVEQDLRVIEKPVVAGGIK